MKLVERRIQHNAFRTKLHSLSGAAYCIIMVRILIGIFFIIGGASGHFVLRGTGSGVALALFGVVLVALGIVQMISKEDNDSIESTPAPKEQLSIVNEDKLVVYSKAHESLGVMEELKYGQKMLVNMYTDFDRFYQVRISNGRTGYILKSSNFAPAQ